MQFQGRKLRHEFKYYLNTHEYLSLSQKAAALLRMDSHSPGREGYGIRSLYFDGVHDHSLHDKNNGVFAREKYRIRIYNGSKDHISLERKSKYGDYVCKDAARLTHREYESIMNGDAEILSKREEALVQQFRTALVHRAFRPVVIVDYIREAYVYDLGNVRITFDKMLSAGVNTVDLFDDAMVLREAIMGPLTIMEVKYDSFLPVHVRQIIETEKHVRSSISKYVICREARYRHFKE
ncbi:MULTISPECIES: polyphosphate polymerase domain-containing protein [Paenibacillus]|uniref:Molecular chaperone n=1 Tax=Paenibacillus vini TaxID=1476024 RepID=A0ABQ4M603_9BACL|nr:polyphosphate polymerase domain-containing protein [Paenibacillus vini]GIP51424.1 molecular chaperone [Paenibacillus vini]